MCKPNYRIEYGRRPGRDDAWFEFIYFADQKDALDYFDKKASFWRFGARLIYNGQELMQHSGSFDFTDLALESPQALLELLKSDDGRPHWPKPENP